MMIYFHWSQARWFLISLAASTALLALTGCNPANDPRPETIRYVDREVRKECPDVETRERLRRERPDPLRNQPMPATPVERNAQAQAQLGLYEAEGGWADQVDTALDRCQQP